MSVITYDGLMNIAQKHKKMILFSIVGVFAYKSIGSIWEGDSAYDF